MTQAAATYPDLAELENCLTLYQARAKQTLLLRGVKLLTPHEEQAKFIRHPAKRKMVCAGRRGGKAQPLTSLIYTPTGPVNMADIQVGQEILTPAGSIAIVQGIFPQGIQDIYRITFGDGTSADCTGDHLWEISEHRTDSKWGKRSRIVTAKEIEQMPSLHGTNRKPKLPPTIAVEFKEHPVPIDPYLLGIILADGTMTQESVKVSAYDSHIRQEIEKRLPSGVSMRREQPPAHDYVLTVGRIGIPNPLIRQLKKLGLWGNHSHNKFIPDSYKYNSLSIRLKIIQGIMDADGWVDHNGQPRLEQTSQQLARDVAEIVQSLGGLSTLNTKINSYKYNGIRKDARLVYRQAILCSCAADLFTLPHKKAKAKNRARNVQRYFKSVELIGQAEAQCIQISDARGLYLTNNFIATHNTVGVGIYAVEKFLEKRRVLYAAPTSDQLQRFWVTITRALQGPIEAKRLYKNETEHIIEMPGTETRIRAKTAWNADSLRGDYADVLILDEWQLMNEDTWSVVGAPMLLDNNGDATFIYTPPSLHSRSASKANDPQHAVKLFKKYQAFEKNGNERFATFHFRSMDNPHISKDALDEISQDMTSLSYRMEILAENIDEAPGALWRRQSIDEYRVVAAPAMNRVIVAIDPSTTSEGDEAGIIGVGSVRRSKESYVLADRTTQGSPLVWAQAAVDLYHELQADCIIAESNQGGEMVGLVIGQVDPTIKVKLVHASRGKQTRAEPVAAQYEQGRGHHVGHFPALENEMVMWTPGDASPNRMDALVWGMTELLELSDTMFSDTDWQ